jgi:hypothetical protein
MKTLIEMVQEEINQLMLSRVAKLTDNKLLSIEKSVTVPKTLIEKIIADYYTSGKTVRQLCVDNGISLSRFKEKRKYYGLEIETRGVNYNGLVDSIKSKSQSDEKVKDILSGISCKDYQLKWNVKQGAYYNMKQKVKKDLAV